MTLRRLPSLPIGKMAESLNPAFVPKMRSVVATHSRAISLDTVDLPV